MKREEFLSVIGDIDDEYIAEAEAYQTSAVSKPTRRGLWLRYGSLATCLLIAFAILIGFEREEAETLQLPQIDMSFILDTVQNSETIDGLPVLHFDKVTAGAGCGNIYIGRNDDLPDNNPWNRKWKFKTLPVYKNTAFGDTSGRPVSVSKDELTHELKRIADELNVQAEDIRYCYAEDACYGYTGNDKENNRACEAEINNDEILLRVSSAKDIYLVYWNGLRVPEEYSVSASDMTKEQAEELTAYLLSEFHDITGLKNPVVCVSKEYHGSKDGNPTWILKAYEDGDNQAEKLLNYSMNTAEFDLNPDGTLSRVRITRDLMGRKKLGDYPLISLGEAEKLLESGKFFTYRGFDCKPAGSEIEKVELIYRSGELLQNFMPYYAFTVRLSEEEDEDFYRDENGEKLKTYSVFYVPAVEGKYIKDFER